MRLTRKEATANPPKSSTERVRKTRESRARRCVRLDHPNVKPSVDTLVSGTDVVLDERSARGVVEELGKDVLSGLGVSLSAVVGGVSEEGEKGMRRDERGSVGTKGRRKEGKGKMYRWKERVFIREPKVSRKPVSSICCGVQL
jgi:hypothetical protein